MKYTERLFIMLLLVTVAGCKDEINIFPDGNIELPGGRVRFTLTTNAPILAAPVARTGVANEEGMATGNFWVMVFDAMGAEPKLLEIAQAEPTVSTAPGPYKWITTLKTRTDKVRIVLLANAPTMVYRADGSNPLALAKGMFADGTTYDNVLANLYTAKLAGVLTTVPYTAPTSIVPMSAVFDFNKLDASTALGTETMPLSMPRIIAKITVDNVTPANNSDFALMGVNLHQASAAACLPLPATVANANSKTKYEGADPSQTVNIAAAAVPTTPVAGVKETTAANPLYCYEANAIDAAGLFLIVEGIYKGTPTYYKLSITRATDGTPISVIERNRHYRVLIDNLTLPGYNTYNAAVAAPANNLIKWHIDVTDLSSHDLVDNGQYYLGVSNSEFHLCAFGTNNDIPIATLNYPVVAGVSAPTVIIEDVVPSTGATPVVVTQNPASNTDVRLNFPPLFQSCNVRIHYGNLSKVISVKRKPMMSIASQVNTTYNQPEFVYATIEGGARDWIGFVPRDDLKLPTFGEVINNAGGVFLKLKENIAKTGTTPRYATLYLSRSNHEGRLKVYLQQDNLNTDDIDDKEDVSLDFEPVVGAFWKASQKGERLIRIERPVSGSMDGYWYATVIQYDGRWDVDNGDGVLMDLSKPLDSNVGWLENADETKVESGNDLNFDDKYKVTKSEVIQGQVAFDPATGAKGIYFRMGLQKAYIPTTQYPARYAVILLIYTYTSNVGTTNAVTSIRRQRIFIRQGEGADYLFNLLEPTTSVPSRPLAVKWSPYNLTDPSKQNNTTMTLSNRTIGNGSVAVRGAAFVNYPSQGGYFFSFNDRYAFNPRVQIDSNNASPNYLNSLTDDLQTEKDRNVVNDEVCPTGYRTPRDINAGYFIADVPAFGVVMSSETRQSLFENPVDGGRPQSNPPQPSDPQNQVIGGEGTIVGVYADGFMDRRKLKTPEESCGFKVRTNSVVSPHNEQVAFLGRLLFNPRTLASIYFPYGGSMSPNNGAWVGGTTGHAPYYVGEHAVYGTSTNRRNTGTWWITGYNMIYIGFAEGNHYIPTMVAVAPFSNFSLANIRCVKE